MFKRLLISIFILFMFNSAVFSATDFTDIVKQIKNESNKVWNPPVYYKRHTSDVYFKINKDGSISDIKLYKSSKVPQLDIRAIEAVSSMKKFDELPSFYDADYIEVILSMTNYIYEDMKNPNLYQKKKNIKQNELIPVNTRLVKIDRIIFDEFFSEGDSNFEDNMKDLVYNLDIQKAAR